MCCRPPAASANPFAPIAARLLPLDRGHVMSGSVYPFRAEDKKAVLDYVNSIFRRYTKNENPNGMMKDFLKDYGDVFNMAWMNIILNQREDNTAAS